MRVLSLFDGISCGQVALEKAGMKVVAYCEINKWAKKIVEVNNVANG